MNRQGFFWQRLPTMMSKVVSQSNIWFAAYFIGAVEPCGRPVQRRWFRRRVFGENVLEVGEKHGRPVILLPSLAGQLFSSPRTDEQKVL